MKKNRKTKSGFTLIELSLSLGLIAIILGMGLLYTENSQARADFNTQVSVLVSYLRLAQSNTIAGLGNGTHGIHLTSDSYTIFTGSSYVPDSPANHELPLPPTVVIDDIALNGGGNDIIFTAPSGETNTYGSFRLYSSRINKSQIIYITRLGTINY